jgi:hypothetical protein
LQPYYKPGFIMVPYINTEHYPWKIEEMGPSTISKATETSRHIPAISRSARDTPPRVSILETMPESYFIMELGYPKLKKYL